MRTIPRAPLPALLAGLMLPLAATAAPLSAPAPATPAIQLAATVLHTAPPQDNARQEMPKPRKPAGPSTALKTAPPQDHARQEMPTPGASPQVPGKVTTGDRADVGNQEMPRAPTTPGPALHPANPNSPGMPKVKVPK